MIKKIALILLPTSLFFLVSCGKSDSAGNDANLSELQLGLRGDSPSLISVFGFAPSNNAGAVLAFYSNKRYFSGVAQKVSATHYRMAAVIGYYEENGNTITTTGKKTTCQALSQKYKGAKKVLGSVSGNSVVVHTGTTTVLLNRINVSQFPSNQQGVVIEWGCFSEINGAFTREEWSDVK